MWNFVCIAFRFWIPCIKAWIRKIVSSIFLYICKIALINWWRWREFVQDEMGKLVVLFRHFIDDGRTVMQDSGFSGMDLSCVRYFCSLILLLRATRRWWFWLSIMQRLINWKSEYIFRERMVFFSGGTRLQHCFRQKNIVADHLADWAYVNTLHWYFSWIWHNWQTFWVS